MTRFAELYKRYVATKFPSLGKSVGHFPLYDSIVAGYASRLAVGSPLDEGALELDSDPETRDTVASLRIKNGLTSEEREFLDYYSLLQEMRRAIEAEAEKREF